MGSYTQQFVDGGLIGLYVGTREDNVEEACAIIGRELSSVHSDGITEDVIAHLSKIRTMQVISRTSVMPFKARQASLREIGSKLGVATLLGAVRAGRIAPVSREMILNFVSQHLLGQEKSY